MNTRRGDLVHPELRKIESEIDIAFAQTPLASIPFAQAAWYLLAVGEDLSLRDHSGGRLRKHELRASVDNFVNFAKWPMYWLWKTCSPGGSAPTEYNDDLYGYAHELLQLAEQYAPFETIYTYASHGFLTLSVKNNHILASGPMSDDVVYDAYDRLTEHLLRVKEGQPDVGLIRSNAREVRFKEGRFWYPLSNARVRSAVRAFAPLIDPMFELPGSSPLTSFTLADYKKVVAALSARCLLHSTARNLAAAQGCENLGLMSAVLIYKRDGLIRKLHGDSDVRGNVVANIVSFLTRRNESE